MKYFFDTEFIEDGHTIDLISIGIVAEDGREFYGISTEFDASKASDWVKENVLIHLPPNNSPVVGPYYDRWQLRDRVLEFVGQDSPEFWADYCSYDWIVLCQLFGTMMDLPKGWPMYCNDFQQLLKYLNFRLETQFDCIDPEIPHNALSDAKALKKTFDKLPILG